MLSLDDDVISGIVLELLDAVGGDSDVSRAALSVERVLVEDVLGADDSMLSDTSAGVGMLVYADAVAVADATEVGIEFPGRATILVVVVVSAANVVSTTDAIVCTA